MDEPKIGRAPEITAAEAFAMFLETACEDFEILQDMIRGQLQVSAPKRNEAAPAIKEERRKEFRAMRAPSRIQMALAKSFVFNARRANRICTLNKAALDVDRAERKQFLRATDPLTPVRDVNEHGFDGKDSTKPSMHEQGGGRLDETSMVVAGPEKILMGPLNLYEVYLEADRMRKLAGFHALFDKKKRGAAP